MAVPHTVRCPISLETRYRWSLSDDVRIETFPPASCVGVGFRVSLCHPAPHFAPNIGNSAQLTMPLNSTHDCAPECGAVVRRGQVARRTYKDVCNVKTPGFQFITRSIEQLQFSEKSKYAIPALWSSRKPWSCLAPMVCQNTPFLPDRASRAIQARSPEQRHELLSHCT
jgi:hypothetical protein